MLTINLSPEILATTVTLSSMMKMISESKSLLNMLILLEGISLMLITLSIFMFANNTYNATFIALTIIAMGACEASLALSVLVSITRAAGSDKLPSISSLC